MMKESSSNEDALDGSDRIALQTHTLERESVESPPAHFRTPKSTNRRKMTDDDALRIRKSGCSVETKEKSTATGDAGLLRDDEKRTTIGATPPRDEPFPPSKGQPAANSTVPLREMIQSIPREAYESILGMSGSSNLRMISWGLLLLPPEDPATSATSSYKSVEDQQQQVTIAHLLHMRYSHIHAIPNILSHVNSLLVDEVKLDLAERPHILPPIFTTTTKVSLKQMLETPHPWILTRVQGVLQLTVVDDRVASLLLLESSPPPPAAGTSNTTKEPTLPKSSKRKKKKKRKQQQHVALYSKPPSSVIRTPERSKPPPQDNSSNDGSVSSRSANKGNTKAAEIVPPPPPPPPQTVIPQDEDDHDWEPVQARRKKTPKIQRHSIRRSRKGKESETISPTKPTDTLQQRDKDQNTAPTYQETVLSKSTNTTEAVKSPIKSQQQLQAQQQQAVKSPSSLPPLPRLLSPENVSSATSSVASSLEHDRGKHHHHHTVLPDNAKEGYHLLDVCDRLSRDMSLFMSRRAVALNIRRRERNMLIAKLQDTINGLWSKRRVQLYGSCATELDLPASDIDVVVMGLNDEELPTEARSADSNKQETDQYPPTTNADRVRRLAKELEQQSWAVQVRAIPTASVPVIKILADPSKLEVMHHQQLAEEAAAVAGKSFVVPLASALSDSDEFQTSSLLPWRGSDVMNGLLSLDITFEGKEHGGLWSTEFSAMVVSQICAQTGLHPDATPFVQTLMVLKELLAQRKLNEPYSGGLSSYALLLLLLALVNERQVIREEIERVELQKRAMADGIDSSPEGAPGMSMNYAAAMKPLPTGWYQGHEFTYSSHRMPNLRSANEFILGMQRAPPPPLTSASFGDRNARNSLGQSSWAAIAKQPQPHRSNVTKQPHSRDENVNKAVSLSTPDTASPKQKSFADAVVSSLASSSNEEPVQVADTISEKFPSLNKVAAANNDSKLTNAKPKKVSKTTSMMGQRSDDEKSSFATPEPNSGRMQSIRASSTAGNATFTTAEISIDGVTPTPCYPQGYNDIVEVLCSGEPTSGKLLMHFLLYYGQHFDAQSTAIDVAGKHERDFNQKMPFAYFSPYIPRRSHGVIDPVTGMLTVDPIVVYEPFEEAQDRNVARRCFAWNSVKWIFAQSYSTLASAVERSKTPPATPGGAATSDVAPNLNDDDPSSSSLLRCLLSF